MRICFLGTGPFAVPTLQAVAASKHQVLCAVSRPPLGRRAEAAPVTLAAEELGVETWLPETVNSDESRERLNSCSADLLVVCDYGEILRSATLATTHLGGINLHGSLLPKYRGAAPVQWAILNGDLETGNTVIQMTPGLDAGPALGVERIAIDPDETALELEARMALRGAPLVLDVISNLEAGTAQPLVQDSTRATRAPRLAKADGRIDWTRTALEIKNQVRGLQPWPRAYCVWQRPVGDPLRLILHRVSLEDTTERSGHPGEILGAEGELVVGTGDGALRVAELQPAGKRVMRAADFLRGQRIAAGQFLN